MKKIRSCPFGYRMENGTYTVVPEERRLIEQIFTRYLDGASLQQLSIMAEATGLKFRENASSWNKNMVSRILDNSRYWDGEQYPPIVEREIAMKVADLKQSKASPRSQTPFIQKRMTCPYCGSEHTYLVQGNEHTIKEIVVYEEDRDDNVDEKAENHALEEIEHEDNGAMPIAEETSKKAESFEE